MPSKQPAAPKKKRRDRSSRRARTNAVATSSSESSSSSEESSEEDIPLPTTSVPKKKSTKSAAEPAKKKRKRASKADDSTINGETDSAGPQRQKQKPAVDEPQAPSKPSFEDLYLREVTSAMANDLEKLRSAPDFKDSTIPILVKSLRQGAALFSERERAVVLGISTEASWFL